MRKNLHLDTMENLPTENDEGEASRFAIGERRNYSVIMNKNSMPELYKVAKDKVPMPEGNLRKSLNMM